MHPFEPTEISKGLRVAGVSQGVILWSRGALTSQWESLLDIWDWLTQRRFWVPPIYARSSTDLNWRPFDKIGLVRLRTEIQRASGNKPVWRFKLSSTSPEVSDRSFEFCNLQPTLGQGRASYVLVRLPLQTDPKDVLEKANRLADALSFHAGSAGYMFDFVEAQKALAYDQIWAWSRRYWGIEVIDVQRATWDILNGTYGVNWLTLIGNEMLSSKLADVDLLLQPRPGLELRPVRHGIMVQAGPRPLLGDMNRFEDVSAYVAASQLLQPAFLKEAQDFKGMFTDHKSTAAWIRRFVEPDKWLEPEAV